MAAVALHLAFAVVVTFQQFTIASLLSLLLNVVILSEVNRADHGSDFWEEWFLDFTALFFVFESLITVSWGVTETLIRLGLSTVITEQNCHACHFLMQLIPAIFVLTLYYWPSPRLQECCIVIVDTFSTNQPPVQGVQPCMKPQSQEKPSQIQENPSQSAMVLKESKPVVKSN